MSAAGADFFVGVTQAADLHTTSTTPSGTVFATTAAMSTNFAWSTPTQHSIVRNPYLHPPRPSTPNIGDFNCGIYDECMDDIAVSATNQEVNF